MAQSLPRLENRFFNLAAGITTDIEIHICVRHEEREIARSISEVAHGGVASSSLLDDHEKKYAVILKAQVTPTEKVLKVRFKYGQLFEIVRRC